MLSPESRHVRAKIAAAICHTPDADTSDLRRDLRVARLAERIEAAVAAAPEFTPEQVERLRALLTPPSTGNAA